MQLNIGTIPSIGIASLLKKMNLKENSRSSSFLSGAALKPSWRTFLLRQWLTLDQDGPGSLKIRKILLSSIHQMLEILWQTAIFLYWLLMSGNMLITLTTETPVLPTSKTLMTSLTGNSCAKTMKAMKFSSSSDRSSISLSIKLILYTIKETITNTWM